MPATMIILLLIEPHHKMDIDDSIFNHVCDLLTDNRFRNSKTLGFQFILLFTFNWSIFSLMNTSLISTGVTVNDLSLF